MKDSEIKNAKPQSKKTYLSVGFGLHCEVWPNGAKYWRMRYRWRGKPRLESLGVYPDVSLKDAIAKRDAIRDKLAQKIDPRSQYQSGGEFEKVATDWLEIAGADISERHRSSIKSRIDRVLLAEFAGHVSNIEPDQVFDFAKKLNKSDMSRNQMKKHLSDLVRILDFAVIMRHCQYNAAAAVSKMYKKEKYENFQALTEPKDIDILAKVLRGIDTHPKISAQARDVLNLQVLLFPRPIELKRAEQPTVDLSDAIWANRLAKHKKTGNTWLDVPLSRQAAEIIEPRLDGRRYLWRGHGSELYSINYPLRNLRKIPEAKERNLTVHGFRATAHSLLRSELGYKSIDIREQALGHAVSTANGTAYDRANLLSERRVMMQDWADFITDLKKTTCDTIF